MRLPELRLANLSSGKGVNRDTASPRGRRFTATTIQKPEGERTVRRLVLLTVGALLATAGIAYAAIDNTVTYSGVGSHKGTPSKTKPANFTYTGTLHIDTNPPGSQPEVAPVTDVYFDKAIKNNSKYFPFCNASEIDGQQEIPAKCKKAIVGSGTATAYAGKPGSPLSSSIKEDLTVTAMNGPSGKNLALVVKSAPGAPVALPNRVIPGSVRKSSGIYGFLVRFTIPQDLQNQLGLDISLTDFKVKISGTPRKVKVGKVFKKISYLQLQANCKGKLHSKAIAQFRDAETGQMKPVISEATAKC
jgi:hypothetical protein